MQIREELENLIAASIAAACDDATLELAERPAPALERPRDLSNGDWASTVAMRTAKLAHKNPREIAQIIVDHLPENNMIALLATSTLSMCLPIPRVRCMSAMAAGQRSAMPLLV